MGQIEFQVTTDLAPITGTQIETNFEAVRDWLTEELAPYATMVVTPDAIGDAKKTRASIRKVADSIDSQRKAIKKMWMKPFEDYESKCKELTGIVNDAVSNIDGQIKAMENEVKEQKRQRLEALFIEKSADITEYVTFADVFDSKWLNSTYSEIDAANSIASQLDDIRDGLDAIRTMESPYEAAMLSEYSKNHNLSKALAEGKRLEAIQRAEEERKAREAETAFSESEVSSQPATEPSVPAPQATAQFIRPVADEAPREKTYSYEFTFPSLTKMQMMALKDCLTINNITYEARRIKE